MYKSIICLALAVLCHSLSCASDTPTSESKPPTKTCIRGYIRTADESPVEGVEVRCFEIDPRYSYEFVWQRGTQLSNDQGQYTFHILSNREYRIKAGGKKSTRAESKKFIVYPDKDISLEDLIVAPATASLKGRILNSDGSPASGLLYACQSENFHPFHPFIYPKTDLNGVFHIPNVLGTEQVEFWVVPSSNKVQVWMGVSPNSEDIVFRLNPKEFVELPPEWKKYFDIEALARQMKRTKAQKKIDFTLADLKGNQVSMGCEQLRGKVVLVNIFGSWCGGCRTEIPHLVQLKEKYAEQGLEIVGIAFERDSEETAEATVREFVEKRKINYPILFGGQEKRTHVISTIDGLERFSGYPTTIFIGRDGTVEDVKVGFKGETRERIEWQISKFEEIIVRLLAKPLKDG